VSFDVSTSLTARHDQVVSALAASNCRRARRSIDDPIDLDETPVVTYALQEPGRSMAELWPRSRTARSPRGCTRSTASSVNVFGGSATGNNASAYRVDGQPAVAVDVVKRASANTLDVADEAPARSTRFGRRNPELDLDADAEQATYIREATARRRRRWARVVLAVIVILPFLRDWRATRSRRSRFRFRCSAPPASCGCCISTSRRSRCSRSRSWSA
jgi:hypothetical protein